MRNFRIEGLMIQLMDKVSARVLQWKLKWKLLFVKAKLKELSDKFLLLFLSLMSQGCHQVKTSRSLCLCFWELPARDTPTFLVFFWLLRDLSNNRLMAIPPNLFVLLGDLLQLWVLFAPAALGFWQAGMQDFQTVVAKLSQILQQIARGLFVSYFSSEALRGFQREELNMQLVSSKSWSNSLEVSAAQKTHTLS